MKNLIAAVAVAATAGVQNRYSEQNIQSHLASAFPPMEFSALQCAVDPRALSRFMDRDSQIQDAVDEVDALRATQLSGHRSDPLIASLMSDVVASGQGPPAASIVLPPVSLSTPSNTSVH